MGFLEGSLVIEQVAKVHTPGGWPLTAVLGPGIDNSKIRRAAQKDYYIPRFVSGEFIGSFA